MDTGTDLAHRSCGLALDLALATNTFARGLHLNYSRVTKLKSRDPSFTRAVYLSSFKCRHETKHLHNPKLYINRIHKIII